MPIPRAYRNDPNAPWNDDPCPECPQCEETIADVEDHTKHCPDKMTQEEIAEYYHERQAPEYDPVEHKYDL